MSDIQVNYEILEEMEKVTEGQHERLAALCKAMNSHIAALQKGGFVGQGATAFYAEMNDAVMPRMMRLSAAMLSLSEVLRSIRSQFESAEEEARSQVDKQMGSVSQGEYTVKPGDTLWDIGQRHGVTVDELVAANNIKDRNLIHPGDVLQIPSRSDGGSSQVSQPTTTPNSRQEMAQGPVSPKELNQRIASYQVETNPRYAKLHDNDPNTYDTYCNLFAHDVAKSFGADVPLYVDGTNGRKWLGATAMKQWLDGRLDVPGNYTQGPQNGWVKLSTTDAISAANNGYVTLAAGRGHMAVFECRDSGQRIDRGCSHLTGGRTQLHQRTAEKWLGPLCG